MSGTRLSQSCQSYTVTGHLKEAIRLADQARDLADHQNYDRATTYAGLAAMHAAISTALAATPLY